jgi:hypothetical protein
VTAFYVGQKVRVVRVFPGAKHALELIGKTGVISAPLQLKTSFTSGIPRMRWGITLDIPIRHYSSLAWVVPENLEPITPPHQPADADFTERLNEQFREVFAPVKVTQP